MWLVIAPLVALVAFCAGIAGMSLAIGAIGYGPQLIPVALVSAYLGVRALRWHMRGLGYWPVR